MLESENNEYRSTYSLGGGCDTVEIVTSIRKIYCPKRELEDVVSELELRGENGNILKRLKKVLKRLNE